ncbi:(d)CMP kinase [Granulicella tundricola]|uniref:Cytidylate kinase n=1 Tax=Granulicella tundricola (strain ATCC BAA-1859 / DSM 23138 / MP5ACTX9) TaxID=1198114 RepID=E8WXW6_GRATM|nr:(d)CMP kinase [Granulicella tundricola]ADW69811.1 cytidylate kinase [Granulicella tundricola MP5ACTX9]
MTTPPPNPTPRQQPVIAIDGPAGAGKSTLAAHLARRFGFLNLETGAMYRALAYKAIDSDLDLDDEVQLLALTPHTTIALEPTREGNRVLLDGRDVSRRIRDADVTAAASRLSVHPRVRVWMVAQQRALGIQGGVVMEGRDIGTAVFPDAEVKIFLDADPNVRGTRRFRQVAPDQHEVAPVTEAAVLAEMRARDDRDRNRAESPLKPAPDAILLDSTSMSLDEVLARSEEIVRAHLPPTENI